MKNVKLYNIKEVSQRTGIPISTLYQLVHYNKIQPVKQGWNLFTEETIKQLKKIKKYKNKKGRKSL
jgi:DNA-binding transcriptional MerR regulator